MHITYDISEFFDILCDKNYGQLQWFLLIEKNNKFNNEYEKLHWVAKKDLEDFQNFNKFISEVEEENKKIIQNISKLEQKEEIISKLRYKIEQLEKKLLSFIQIDNINIQNMGQNIKNIEALYDDENLPLEKRFNLLKQKNFKLKNYIFANSDSSASSGKNRVVNKNSTKNKNNINKNLEDEKEEDNKNEENNASGLGEESESEINELKVELENARQQIERNNIDIENLENEMKIIREACVNLFCKMTIPKKFKGEIKQILKIFGCNDAEIIFIVDKKK